ncbi:hypothetical protein HAX54_003247, partial [Datura stramonium]|nr:hypothetical protein [Datura stramonium]
GRVNIVIVVEVRVEIEVGSWVPGRGRDLGPRSDVRTTRLWSRLIVKSGVVVGEWGRGREGGRVFGLRSGIR